jgi:cytochrome bd-type quinol oxidase subunit 2
MNKHFLTYGVVGWIVATAALRAGGQHLLRSSEWKGILVLYLVSFILMAALARRLLLTLRINQEQVLGAVASLLLPTLLLDPFSSAFFPVVFPNMVPDMAGAFGGWMLISCAGALVGGMTHRMKPTR